MEVKTIKVDNLELLKDKIAQELVQQPITDKYMSWRYKDSQISVVAYTSGKVVFSGNGDINKYLLHWGVLNSSDIEDVRTEDSEKNLHSNSKSADGLKITDNKGKFDNTISYRDGAFVDIGSDEAGKGEYWGPLCVCAIYLENGNIAQINKLKELGVKDSKKLSDIQVIKLASQIKKVVKYELIVLALRDFNKEMELKKNISIIMGDLHAKAINNIIAELNEASVQKSKSKSSKCEELDIVVDKFSSVSNRIDGKLISYTPGGISDADIKGDASHSKVNLHQIEKGEQYLAVACASIIARQAYLENIEKLSKKYDFIFPKGYTNIEKTIIDFVALHGEDALYDVAKVSFKTTKRALPNFRYNMK